MRCENCYYSKTLGRTRMCDHCEDDDCYKYSGEEKETEYVFKGLPAEDMYDNSKIVRIERNELNSDK